MALHLLPSGEVRRVVIPYPDTAAVVSARNNTIWEVAQFAEDGNKPTGSSSVLPTAIELEIRFGTMIMF